MIKGWLVAALCALLVRLEFLAFRSTSVACALTLFTKRRVPRSIALLVPSSTQSSLSHQPHFQMSTHVVSSLLSLVRSEFNHQINRINEYYIGCLFVCLRWEWGRTLWVPLYQRYHIRFSLASVGRNQVPWRRSSHRHTYVLGPSSRRGFFLAFINTIHQLNWRNILFHFYFQIYFIGNFFFPKLFEIFLVLVDSLHGIALSEEHDDHFHERFSNLRIDFRSFVRLLF